MPRAPIRRFSTVIFDCDSTLSAVEGIEELARNHRTEVAELTEAAMRGEIPLEQVYGRRLDLSRPNCSALAALGQRYIDAVVDDARETCTELQAAGIDVRIISGGLLPAVVQLARFLGVPEQHVAAVDIRFHEDGSYAGFDSTSPLARSGGKLDVIKAWLPVLRPYIMMVGDGSTDLEARPAVDLFVAYAGVVSRDAVVRQADVVIRSRSLAPVMALAAGNDRELRPSGELLRKRGLTLLNKSEA